MYYLNTKDANNTATAAGDAEAWDFFLNKCFLFQLLVGFAQGGPCQNQKSTTGIYDIRFNGLTVSSHSSGGQDSTGWFQEWEKSVCEVHSSKSHI